MVDASPEMKKLKIKTSVVRRIWKEYYGYQQEEVRQRDRIQKLIADHSCQSDVNKQTEVLQETMSMYTNIFIRLNDAQNDLKLYLDENSGLQTINESQDKQDAELLIQQVKDFLKANNPAC